MTEPAPDPMGFDTQVDPDIIVPPNEDAVERKLRIGRRQAAVALCLTLVGVAVSFIVAFVKPEWLDKGVAYSVMLWSALFWWWAYDNMKDAHNLVVHDYNAMVDEFNDLSDEYDELWKSAENMANIAEGILDQHGPRVAEEDVDEAWQDLKARLEEKP